MYSDIEHCTIMLNNILANMKIFDSLSHMNKFVVSDTKKDLPIKMYVCGPTVYNAIHIGNARSLVVFDLLFRILRQIYGVDNVVYVRNITDVDDKIINEAKKRSISIKELTSETIDIFNEDTKYLNCLAPTHQPKVTDNIDKIVELINILLSKDIAYKTDSGIYFEVKKYANYMELSKRIPEKEYSNVRFQADDTKRSPQDFALWKFTDDECSFASPWGRGRPGWHIECSALSAKYLGNDFHIHGGGIDLLFPHHTNERAQSICAFEGSTHANIWMHNGMVTVNGEKMSKSLNNTVTIKQLREKGMSGEVLRLFLLSTHYRKPVDYTEEKLFNMKQNLEYITYTLEKYKSQTNQEGGDPRFHGYDNGRQGHNNGRQGNDNRRDDNGRQGDDSGRDDNGRQGDDNRRDDNGRQGDDSGRDDSERKNLDVIPAEAGISAHNTQHAEAGISAHNTQHAEAGISAHNNSEQEYRSLGMTKCDPTKNQHIIHLISLLENDLNTGLVFNEIIHLCKQLNKQYDSSIHQAVAFTCQLFGLTTENTKNDIDETHIEAQILLRQQAKNNKDFEKADNIRKDLLNKGIKLEDYKNGTTQWFKVI